MCTYPPCVAYFLQHSDGSAGDWPYTAAGLRAGLPVWSSERFIWLVEADATRGSSPRPFTGPWTTRGRCPTVRDDGSRWKVPSRGKKYGAQPVGQLSLPGNVLDSIILYTTLVRSSRLDNNLCFNHYEYGLWTLGWAIMHDDASYCHSFPKKVWAICLPNNYLFHQAVTLKHNGFIGMFMGISQHLREVAGQIHSSV